MRFTRSMRMGDFIRSDTCMCVGLLVCPTEKQRFSCRPTGKLISADRLAESGAISQAGYSADNGSWFAQRPPQCLNLTSHGSIQICTTE